MFNYFKSREHMKNEECEVLNVEFTFKLCFGACAMCTIVKVEWNVYYWNILTKVAWKYIVHHIVHGPSTESGPECNAQCTWEV